MSVADEKDRALSLPSIESRVAVVIPCYNDGRYVAEAVASAASQEECEVIVVDDGSTDDETLRTLGSLEAEGIRVLRQQNMGPAAARMAGVRATFAPYVQTLDADDRLAPGIVAKLADALESEPRASAAWGYVETFGSRVSRFPTWPGIDPWRLSFVNEVPSALMLERQALLAVGGWAENGYEDWDLAMKAAEGHWLALRLDEVSVLHREHDSPRRLDDAIARDEIHRAQLRDRYPKLLRDRPLNRRGSRSAWPIKIVWPLIDRTPLLSGLQKHTLLIFTRDLFEPRMRPSDIAATRFRIIRRLARLRG